MTSLKITEPFHGAVIDRNHGTQKEDGLSIDVMGHAPLLDHVTVNGSEIERMGEDFVGTVLLKDVETEIVAVSESVSGRGEHRVRVVHDKNSEPRYSFVVDDCVLFLRDIARQKYASLFESPFLAMLKDLHDVYGARFVLNLFHELHQNHIDALKLDNFNLSQFPDKYKGEWGRNSDWLRLAFHARSEWPNAPYEHACSEELMHDFDMVAEQIIRFAGEETHSPTTVIHWLFARPDSFPELAKRGVKVLTGYFERPPVKQMGYSWDYSLGDERSEYIARRGALKDFNSGIVFSRADIVCDRGSLEEIDSRLDTIIGNPNKRDVVDISTHEQYFWPFYKCSGILLGDPKRTFAHLPDYKQRLKKVIGKLTDGGYKPVFLTDGYPISK